MNIALDEILKLVGKLDDSPGDDTPRERFRRFLRENVDGVGQVRDYIDECLSSSDPKHSYALQDLINYLGCFLEFDVVFGRYKGVHGQIGFDGHWESASGHHVVVEVKTSETYAIKTSALIGYVDALISDKQIPSWSQALGLYVVAKPHPEKKQLENAIIAEKNVDRLRVVSVESLLSLAEMMSEYDIAHDDVLALLRPSGPTIDPVVELMSRLVAEQIETQPEDGKPPKPTSDTEPLPEPPPVSQTEVNYWLTPVRSDEEQSAEEVIQTLVGKEQIYAFGEKTPGRKLLKPGDFICFYASSKGVVAHAEVASVPKNEPHPSVRHSEKYPWVFDLTAPDLYLDTPVAIDADKRSQLEQFEGRDPTKNWSWFVQATRKIAKHDFDHLVHKEE